MRRTLLTLVVVAVTVGGAYLALPRVRGYLAERAEPLHARCGEKADADCLAEEEWYCRAGVGKACRRLAQAFQCGRAQEAIPAAAVGAYQRACDAGDLPSCRILAAALADRTATPDLESSASDGTRMLAAMTMAGRGDWKGVGTQKSRMRSPDQFAAQFRFIEAARAIDEGRFGDAESLTAPLLSWDDPAIRVLVSLRSLAKDRSVETASEVEKARTYVDGWIAAGTPDLRESAFLVATDETYDRESCYTRELFPASRERAEGEDDLLVRYALRIAQEPVDGPTLAAATRAALGDGTAFATRWVAAAWLSADGLTTEQRAESESTLAVALARLVAEAPGDEHFVTWQRCHAPEVELTPFPPSSKAETARSRTALFDAFTRALSPRPDAGPRAFGATIEVSLALDTAGCSKKLAAAGTSGSQGTDAAITALRTLGDQLSGRGWLVDRFVGVSVLRHAAALSGQPADADRVQSALETAQRFYPAGPTALCGSFPLPKVNHLWLRLLVADEFSELVRLEERSGP